VPVVRHRLSDTVEVSRPVNPKTCILAENELFLQTIFNSVNKKLLVCADWRSLETWLAYSGPRIICNCC
jgi:hypothetical protein